MRVVWVGTAQPASTRAAAAASAVRESEFMRVEAEEEGTVRRLPHDSARSATRLEGEAGADPRPAQYCARMAALVGCGFVAVEPLDT